MKKLMIAAAALLCGVMAQASTVSWNITGVKNSKGIALSTGAAYVFFVQQNSGTADTSAFKKDFESAAALQAALDDANYTYKKSDLATGTAAGTFSYNATTATVLNPVNDLGLAWSTKYSVYAVITDTETITDTTKFYVTTATTAQTTYTETSTQNKSFVPMATSSATSSNWHAVPEPTSGLLLLLGMAGLALRRKQK